MRLHSKLEEWKSAGLIDAQTLESIAQFEVKHAKPQGIFYVTGLGALAIALGLVALVASNWDGIPPFIKIAVLFILGAGLSWAIVRQHAKLKPSVWALDSLILVYSGLVIAGIALIGQIFQLTGSLGHALLVWAAAITPLVFFSLGYIVPLLWALLVLVASSTWVSEYVAIHGRLTPLYVVVSIVTLLPLLFIGLGLWPSLRQRLPHFSKAFSALGWGYLIILGSLGQMAWYLGGTQLTQQMLSTPALMITVAGVCAFFGFMQWASIRVQSSKKALFLVCTLSPFLPLFFKFGLSLVDALSFIIIWALVARSAYENHNRTLFKQATSMVGLRIFILYYDTLGGFLATGVGLVVSGALLILGVRIWYRKSKDFTKSWGQK